MQCGSNAPNNAIANQAGETEGEEVGHERGASELSEGKHGAHARRDEGDLARRLLPRRQRMSLFSFCDLSGTRGRDWRRSGTGSRGKEVAVM